MPVLDRLWRESDPFHPGGNYIGPGGLGQTHGRYDRFGKFYQEHLARGVPLVAPILELEERGGDLVLWVYNGRHRMAWLRDHGIPRMPVWVLKRRWSLWKRAAGMTDLRRDTVLRW